MPRTTPDPALMTAIHATLATSTSLASTDTPSGRTHAIDAVDPATGRRILVQVDKRQARRLQNALARLILGELDPENGPQADPDLATSQRDYPHLRAYGSWIGSAPHDVDQDLRDARRIGAPADVITVDILTDPPTWERWKDWEKTPSMHEEYLDIFRRLFPDIDPDTLQPITPDSPA